MSNLLILYTHITELNSANKTHLEFHVLSSIEGKVTIKEGWSFLYGGLCLRLTRMTSRFLRVEKGLVGISRVAGKSHTPLFINVLIQFVFLRLQHGTHARANSLW